MFKNNRTIILILLVVVLIAGGFYAYSSYSKKKKAETAGDTAASQATTQVNNAISAVPVVGNVTWAPATVETIGTNFQVPHLLDLNAAQAAKVSVAPGVSPQLVNVVSQSNNVGTTAGNQPVIIYPTSMTNTSSSPYYGTPEILTSPHPLAPSVVSTVSPSGMIYPVGVATQVQSGPFTLHQN